MELVKEILNEVGIEYRYHHFETEEAIPPPFICWLVPGSDNFSADGKVFFKADRVHIELYTEKRDFELEKKIEDVLDLKEIFWEKSGDYIESEKMYEVLYEISI